MTFPKVTKELLQEDGVFPNLSWPGLYQILYVSQKNGPLCNQCATMRFKEGETDIVYGTFEESDSSVDCADCGAEIEPDIDLSKEEREES